jgi:hypothetical protein
MAQYKYPGFLQQNNNPEFDKTHQPGFAAPWSGIYKCTACGWEATCNRNDPLPPQNHNQHTTQQGAIRWQLIVAHGTIP